MTGDLAAHAQAAVHAPSRNDDGRRFLLGKLGRRRDEESPSKTGRAAHIVHASTAAVVVA
jgi:hypothetical protein